MASLEEWLCHQNIALLRTRLAEAADDGERARLHGLLTEQEDRLAELTADPPGDDDGEA
jgi:hypothetical protein